MNRDTARIIRQDNSHKPLEKPLNDGQAASMAQPIDVSVPHKLGREEAKRRIAANMGSLQRHIPGGAAVTSNWVGDRLDLGISALGQTVGERRDAEHADPQPEHEHRRTGMDEHERPGHDEGGNQQEEHQQMGPVSRIVDRCAGHGARF